MTQEHPITPSPEWVEQWASAFYGTNITPGEFAIDIATQAARWGADTELEACCEWTRDSDGYDAALALRADRRPKPPSLKEQALQALEAADGADHPVVATVLTADQHALIRTALESLPD